MEKSDMFWQKYLHLEKDFLEIADNILITDVLRTMINGTEHIENNENQLSCYSPKICDFIVECCVEIESISKELYFDNNINIGKNKNVHFDYECLAYFEKNWHINEKNVNIISPIFELHNIENRKIKPLERNVKDENGTLKTNWNISYQAVKHDRYNALSKGTIKSAYFSLAALYLLNIYMKNINIRIGYDKIKSFDYTFSSNLFSTEKPIDNGMLWYKNEAKHSSSPLIYKYTDLSEKVLKEKQEEDEENKIEWINSQPECSDDVFNKYVLKEMKNPSSKKQNWNIIEFIVDKRIRDIVLTSDDFEGQKEKLIKTYGWKLYLYNNKRIDNNIITKENIEEMIEHVVMHEYLSLIRSFRKSGWEDLAQTYACNLRIDKYEQNSFMKE